MPRTGYDLTGIDDDHAVVANNHSVGGHLVTDGGVNVLGDLDDRGFEHFVALEQMARID